MSAADRLDRLEHRIAVLERLMRQLAAGPGRAPIDVPPPAPSAAAPPGPAPLGPRPLAPKPSEVERPVPAVRPPAGEPALQPPPVRWPDRFPRVPDTEQWLGQRGLLAMGVLLVVLAAAYLLKLSFERGWISPAVRCAGGALAGILVGAAGWRLESRGLRTYGSALIGTGAAIIYLAVWAASRLYGFLPPISGIAALALVSLSLSAIAFAIDVEALGAAAALGAFLAPAVLGVEPRNYDLLLIYLAAMAFALGWVAARKHWRLAMAIIAVGYFGLTIGDSIRESNEYLLYLFALLGGGAGLWVGLREGWWETRLLSFAGGWALLGYAAESLSAKWLILIGGCVLSAPVWWRGWQWPAGWPVRHAESAPRWSWGEMVYFCISPVLLGWALHQVAPDFFNVRHGLVPLVVAVPYLLAGFTAERLPFAFVGTTFVGVAALGHWNGPAGVCALLLLAHLWAGLDHSFERGDGRFYSLLAFAVAVAHLLFVDLDLRSSLDPAFTGRWAIALWLAIETAVVLAAGLWRRIGRQGPGGETWEHRMPAVLWTAAGLMLLFGVTAEIGRYFRLSQLPEETARLASGLSISAWWGLFGGALVVLGFRRDLKPLRVAGQIVAWLVMVKVVLVDLATLSALYRVASVLIVGLVALGLAYLYHRKSRAAAVRSEGSVPHGGE
jgi:hypothetical protein